MITIICLRHRWSFPHPPQVVDADRQIEALEDQRAAAMLGDAVLIHGWVYRAEWEYTVDIYVHITYVHIYIYIYHTYIYIYITYIYISHIYICI